ncbi:nitrogenase molybdenum-cofactor synthesis protein NifE [Orenia metallireducens]|uniref:Nitrogenase iron-molybdenum cofactor biosynthesis protein NifE n=1 Tax=Orenia metallireducens TaxID=1413210 RepID=A0A285GFR1_9FIRM|nr:nitrogenase iron-molybdenum cofactor biosynthesis protein NifE [Orenia metallireducens]PRX30419.1 nitrogenase molybdenum-cofactor synthesis protein NifE [Orenia metallireducens]SNY22422.1 nitrogenase molybdenum-cofactor synthesis protein NifE [Orenia metallireducens]
MSRSAELGTLEERKDSILRNSKQEKKDLKCDQNSVAGAVSQRACVYSGARVVLNPITDAYHLVHGPIGCASYTWDLRGSLTSGAEVFRNSFSTDLREKDIVFGGEKKLTAAIDEIVEAYDPKVVFVYSTCVVGVIGDDLAAVCKAAEQKYNIRVIPVQAPGFAGNKSTGYKAAGNAILELMDTNVTPLKKKGINILGDYNLAGELWILQGYLNRVGIEVNAKFTGDSSCEEIMRAPQAELNIVQCAGSMTLLAKKMEKRYGIPFVKISFVGIDDTIASLRKIAQLLGEQKIIDNVEELIKEEQAKVKEELEFYRQRLEGYSAAIYVGGGFKAISLIKQFNSLGINPVMVGTQNGKKEEYARIRDLTDEGTIILDDANPTELEKFMKERGADILVGGVKERPLAYKLGVAFCDHNHGRKHPLTGFVGAVNFAKELDSTLNSPVWKIIAKESGGE